VKILDSIKTSACVKELNIYAFSVGGRRMPTMTYFHTFKLLEFLKHLEGNYAASFHWGGAGKASAKVENMV
jgi:hypothetical protein